MDDIANRKIFIFHIRGHDRRFSDLKHLFLGHGCEVRDASTSLTNAPSDPEHFRASVLTPLIQWSEIVVVLLSKSTTHNEFLNWVVGYGRTLNKRIIGIWDDEEYDGEPEIPPKLNEFGNAIVPFDPEQVIPAVTGGLDGFLNPDGGARPERPIYRHNC